MTHPHHASIGSSPLARGLPTPTVLRHTYHRIIPARAGFTPATHLSPASSLDHPRSRGVYARSETISSRSTGSSPLARGLLWSGLKAVWDGRIIPARAGFTNSNIGRMRAAQDHPRSRGVYANWFRDTIGPIGSSPLARGLREAGVGGDHRRRIIPARAGFTRPVPRRRRGRRDHPRSRGVYPPTTWRSSSRRGSSPLARGLLQPVLSAVWAGRIIPARAGFTGTSSPTPSPARDHPRSRGVYHPRRTW